MSRIGRAGNAGLPLPSLSLMPAKQGNRRLLIARAIEEEFSLRRLSEFASFRVLGHRKTA